MLRLRATVNQSAWFGLSTLQLHRVARRWNANRALILMYHGVIPDGRPYENWGQLPESKFVWQLEYLKERYRVLPLEELVERLSAGKTLPPHSAAITFDDGFANNVTVAAPHLERLGLPATIFLVTDYIGTEKLLWPDEVFVLLIQSEASQIDLRRFHLGVYPLGDPGTTNRSYSELMVALKSLTAMRKDDVLDYMRERLPPSSRRPEIERDFRLMSWEQAVGLSRRGLIQFGAHTRTHEILTRISRSDARQQIVESCRRVKEELALDRIPFAYPNGSQTDFDPFIQQTLEEEGAECGLSTLEGLNAPGAYAYSLRRVSVGGDATKSRFKLKTSGFISWLQGIRSQLQRNEPAAEPEASLTAVLQSPAAEAVDGYAPTLNGR